MSDSVIGKGRAIHTPTTYSQRSPAKAVVCDKQVPKAAESILGTCPYYYRPLHDEYIQKSGVTTWEALKSWALDWLPWRDKAVSEKLLKKRTNLIPANNTDPDWSRHANFMMRHIGCDHNPPDYYVSYGYYYCSNYGRHLEPRLSEQGKKWLADARKFLQKNLEKGLSDNMKTDTIYVPCIRYPKRSVSMTFTKLELEIAGQTFRAFAFNTHVPAYLDAGLADLPIGDLIKIGGQPNIEEWSSGDTWRQATDSGIEVGKDKAGQAARATSDYVVDKAQAVQRALDRLMSKFK